MVWSFAGIVLIRRFQGMSQNRNLLREKKGYFDIWKGRQQNRIFVAWLNIPVPAWYIHNSFQLIDLQNKNVNMSITSHILAVGI